MMIETEIELFGSSGLRIKIEHPAGTMVIDRGQGKGFVRLAVIQDPTMEFILPGEYDIVADPPHSPVFSIFDELKDIVSGRQATTKRDPLC